MEVLTDSVSHAPALVTLVVLVLAFLKHLKSEGTANRASMRLLERTIASEGEQNRQALKEVSTLVTRLSTTRLKCSSSKTGSVLKVTPVEDATD